MATKLDELAAGQLGLITLDQLRELGFTRPQVRHFVVVGSLIPQRHRVYRLRGAPKSWEQSVLAAVLSAGVDAVASHETAAAVWDLRHSKRPSGKINVTVDRMIRMKGVTGHRTMLTSAERTLSQGVPVTTPERTIIDVAGTLSVEQLGQCVDDAVRRRLISLEQFRRLVEAPPTRAGQPPGKPPGQPLHHPLGEVLAERMPGYRPDDSEFETQMNRLWDELGLPPARRQHRVTIDGHNYRLDRAIVECKVGTEWDSYRYHSAPSDRDYDSNRRARLVGAGWLIIPVTGKSKPELVARAVLRAYADRSGTVGPSNT